MISNKILPSHIIAEYAWQILRDNNGMAPINGMVPMAPIDDEPNFSDSGMAYGIFAYAENESGQLDVERKGVFSLRLTCKTSGQLGAMLNTLSTAFGNRDIITERMNIWSSTMFTGQFVGIRFTELKTSYVEGGEPPDTEGEPVVGVISISYKYISQLEVSLPGTPGLW